MDELKLAKEQMEELKGHYSTASENTKKELGAKIEALEAKLAGQEDELKAYKTQAGAISAGQEKIKSFGEQVSDFFNIKSTDLKSLKDNQRGAVSFDIKSPSTIAVGTHYTGGNVGLTSWDSEFARVPRRFPFLRQIISNRPIGTAGIAWAEQSNLDGGAGMTAEAAAKTQSDFKYTERREVPRKITTFMKASKESLDDLPGLAAEINNELVTLIQLKLDEQLLSGDNTGQNLKGILTYAPAFSAPMTGIEFANEFDVIRASATQIAVNGKGNFVPNYVILHPIDAAKMDMVKDENGQYIIPPFASSGAQSVYGIRVIENIGITQGNFLVGDFSKSVLGIREEININVGYSGTDFTDNVVTILAEMRAYHYIKTNHNTAFVYGTFACAKDDIAA